MFPQHGIFICNKQNDIAEDRKMSRTCRKMREVESEESDSESDSESDMRSKGG